MHFGQPCAVGNVSVRVHVSATYDEELTVVRAARYGYRTQRGTQKNARADGRLTSDGFRWQGKRDAILHGTSPIAILCLQNPIDADAVNGSHEVCLRQAFANSESSVCPWYPDAYRNATTIVQLDRPLRLTILNVATHIPTWEGIQPIRANQGGLDVSSTPQSPKPNMVQIVFLEFHATTRPHL